MFKPANNRTHSSEEESTHDLRFRLVTDTIRDVFWMSTLGVGKMLYISPAYEHIWGRSVEEIYQSPKSFLKAIHPEDLNSYLAIVEAYHAQGAPYECEYRIIQSSGATKWIQERGFPVDELWDGERVMTGICTDITDRKGYEEQLSHLLKHHELILRSTRDGIYGINLDGKVTFVNRAATEILGWSTDELVGRKPHSIVHHTRTDGSPYPAEECRVYLTLLNGQSCEVEDEIFWRKNGTSFPVEYASRPTLEGDVITGAVITFRDISARKKAEQEIKYLASHDTLTKLPNRSLFMDRLEQAMARTKRNNEVTAVMFVDLDGFKAINDDYGHAAGDELLTEVASCMKARLRQSDTIARIGGDEFAIILNKAGDEDQVSIVAKQILRAVAQPYQHHDQEIRIGASIGISLYRQSSDKTLTAAQLLQLSDNAMYVAKRSGRGRYQYAELE